ncbi:thiamine phosphate synthase [Chitinophaga horti]|uniref:Thiamine phosphate synthase n=1 Tax=Chitinophaga horti TaxID=2920382 RepID=A0ABY6IZD6_9BACT|nr:thiamine phosphate synthase [Chitinophaga horti]UYQ92768.1 thiamine phosphate synthase [Chitinophaga horti]
MIWILTSPQAIPDEATHLNALLEAGADVLLLRKPGWEEEAYAQLLDQLSTRFYNRILVAGQPDLAMRYSLLGVHMSEMRRQALVKGVQKPHAMFGSTAVHAVEAIPYLKSYWDGLLVSPVFDSISKQGYKSAINTIPPATGTKLVALGGINVHTAPMARQMGFDGVAVMGALWDRPAESVHTFNNIKAAWHHM